MLYAINHDLRTKLWCGPAAFSILTGLPTSRFAGRVKHMRRSERAVMRVKTRELLAALGQEGFTWTRAVAEVAGLTLAGALPLLTRAAGGKPMLINVTGHFVVVEGCWLIDNQTKLAVRLKDAPHRRKRVKSAWLVEQP